MKIAVFCLVAMGLSSQSFAKSVQELTTENKKVVAVIVQDRETGKSDVIQLAGVMCQRLSGQELLPYQCPITGARYADWDLCDKECK